MTQNAGAEPREPSEEELSEYMDDPYVQQLSDIADRLVVLSNSIDFEMPPEEEPSTEGAELATGSIPLSQGPRSEESRYLHSLSTVINLMDEAIRLRTRICFRQFPLEEHAAASKKKKGRAKQ